VASVVRDMGFLRRNVGQVILASAIVDDTIGWIIIAITLGLASQESFSWLAVGKSALGTIAFLGFSFTLGRRFVFKVIQFTNDHFRGEAPVIAAILVVMGAFALITQLIGVHTVLGAFVAGILVGESPMLTADIDRQLRGLVAGLFMPVFFGLAGLSADLTVLKDSELAMLTFGLVAIASFGKAAGAFTGGWLGGLTIKESTALAMGMNARGSTEVIVASIGLSMGVLSQNLFTMIVAMALITTLAMPPTLRWALQRLPMRREEEERLQREEFEARGFVPNLERILVAVDRSANGRFASRLAGLLAGTRGMPVTVLDVTASEAKPPADASAAGNENPDQEPQAAKRVAAAAAQAGGPKESPTETIDVIQRQHDAPAAVAIAEEARRGYDLLIVGIDPTASPRGEFHENVSRLVSDFEGSIAIVDARGAHALDPDQPVTKILLPVTGNEYSRRGAEAGVTLAKGAAAEATALSVISREAKNKQRRRRESQAVAKEIQRIADHLQTPVKTIIRFDVFADEAILQTIEKGKHDLVVMGVSRRPGDVLAFGDVASVLLKSAKCSLMFVAPQARGAVRSTSKGPPAPAAG
jgi:nucleotide-binding universal stress UspA family protein